jgi:defect in organelle trafficking protein DotC
MLRLPRPVPERRVRGRRPFLPAALLASTLAAGIFPALAHAQPARPEGVPLLQPPAAALAAATASNANPLNNPIAGSRTSPAIVGGKPPPSLDELQATHPTPTHKKPMSPMRATALREAALSYGARGGLAAQSYAINLLLARYQGRLDETFNFNGLVLAISNGQTLMVPPIVTEAEMAFALAPGGQTAKETDRVYQITQEARLASAPPNWRSYLVRTWAFPVKPPRDLRPRTDDEVQSWNRWVAEGWALGEQQATQIFLDDLARLQNDYVGMMRYRVLLRAGVVEAPDTAFSRRAISGGRDRMLVGNQVIRITNQPGLNPDERSWRQQYVPSGGPIGQVP